MEFNLKQIGKVAGAAFAGATLVAASAFVASGAALGAVTEGFKVAKDAVKEILSDETTEPTETSSEESEI